MGTSERIRRADIVALVVFLALLSVVVGLWGFIRTQALAGYENDNRAAAIQVAESLEAFTATRIALAQHMRDELEGREIAGRKISLPTPRPCLLCSPGSRR